LVVLKVFILLNTPSARPTKRNQQRRTNKDEPTKTNQQRRTNEDEPTKTNQQRRTNKDEPTKTNQQRRTNEDEPTKTTGVSIIHFHALCRTHFLVHHDRDRFYGGCCFYRRARCCTFIDSAKYSSWPAHILVYHHFRHIRCSTRWLTFVTFHITLEPFFKTVITITLHLFMPWGINSKLSSPSVATHNHHQPLLHQHDIQEIAAHRYSDENLVKPGINTPLESKLLSIRFT